MNIKEIKIKKFKALNDFEALLNGKNIFICGENGLGKSSLMQAIQICLGNNDVIPQEVYGKGSVVFQDEEGNDYDCMFTISDGISKLELHLPDGKITTKKTEIKDIFSAVTFDIEKFIQWSETSEGRRKQIEWYKSLMDEGDKKILEEFKNKIVQYETQRRDLGRNVKELDGYCKSSPFYGTSIHFLKNIAQVDIALLLSKQENVSKCKMTIETKSQEILKNNTEIQRLEQRIAELKNNNLLLSVDVEKCENWLSENNKEDFESILENAKKKNEEYLKAQDYIKNYDAHTKKQSEYEDLTIAINNCKLEYENFIKSIDIGIDNLVFDEEGLIYNGIPLNKNNLSDSEILEAFVKIMVASNKKTKILCLENSNIIGEKRLKAIIDIAIKNNFQLIAEEVVRGQEKISISFI